MEEKVKVPFWQKTWVVVLACIFIPPAGLALLWVGKKGGMVLRIILTVILAFYSLAWISGIVGGGKTSNTVAPVAATTTTEQAATTEQKPAATTEQKSTEKQPEIAVTATEILSVFEANELKGKETYTGKYAEITGTVGTIGESFGSQYVTLTNGSEYSLISLQCFFNSKYQSQLANLVAGQEVTILGTIGEKSLNISVDDCKLK